MDPLERFFEKIQEDENGCWIWTGTKRGTKKRGGERGQIVFEGQRWLAHRFFYTIFKGEIPEGFEICHAPIICHTPLCVNPEHLRADTRSGNQRDRILDGTKYRKLTEAKVLEIRASDKSHVQLGKDYGVSRQLISDIIAGKRWTHIS